VRLGVVGQFFTGVCRRIALCGVGKVLPGALVAAVVVGGRQRCAVEGAEVVAGVIVTIRVVTVQGSIRFACQPVKALLMETVQA